MQNNYLWVKSATQIGARPLVNLQCFSFAPSTAPIYLESCQKQGRRLCLLCWTNSGGIKGWPWWMESGDWSLSPTKTDWHMIDNRPWKPWLMFFILAAAAALCTPRTIQNQRHLSGTGTFGQPPSAGAGGSGSHECSPTSPSTPLLLVGTTCKLARRKQSTHCPLCSQHASDGHLSNACLAC